MRDIVRIYPRHPRGELKGNRIGTLLRGMEEFDIIRPGFDSQGRKRNAWTQFTHCGIPVFEVKLDVPLERAIARFDELWKTHIDDDEALLIEALLACKAERYEKFKDGVSGESAAPSVTKDGRMKREYPA